MVARLFSKVDIQINEAGAHVLPFVEERKALGDDAPVRAIPSAVSC